MTTPPPTSLSTFQKTYSQYLRAPTQHQRPDGIPQRRSQIYESLLFNNVCGFINKCFPVCKSIIDEAKWLDLSRQFFKKWPSHTPIFSHIPFEFVQFIQQKQSIDPPWLAELLHYEWLELEVDLNPNQVERIHLLNHDGELVQANPTLQLHQYQWPVQKICLDYQPKTIEPVLLCVFRTFDFNVQFMEINAVTGLFIELLQAQPYKPAEALCAFAEHIPSVSQSQINQFGPPLITQLVEANVLVVLQE